MKKILFSLKLKLAKLIFKFLNNFNIILNNKYYIKIK